MKKGFTLIELLAVILILGIIALIAIPTVNNILKEAKRGAFSSTLTNIEKTIENECTLSQIKNKDINYTYTITNGIIYPNVEIKGDLPDGTIYLNNECEIAYALFNNNFTGNKEIGEDVIIDDKISNGIYKEDILNGTDPVISDNLIPVRIEKDGTVFKADLNSKWYSYEEKKWANAVILTEAGKIEENGMILEESIESYFVWVPRFKYKLFNMGNYDSYINGKPTESNKNSIDIVFENKNTPISSGDEVGEYLSHPAFQAFNTNGLWIGKFETSGNINNLNVKPNQQTIRYINVKTMFESSYNYKRNNDSHMMKNTEWGAAVYLSYSIYGVNNEVNINNHNEYMTGYSAVIGTNQSDYPGTFGNTSNVTLPYNTETGYLASTTGNISGIYDMRGGSHEDLASYIDGNYGKSGFTSDPASIYGNKYFDKYKSDSSYNTYKNRILGDATGELGPFYHYTNGNGEWFFHNTWWSDNSIFINAESPWVRRGADYYAGVLSGQFNFTAYSGESSYSGTFRVVLAS